MVAFLMTLSKAGLEHATGRFRIVTPIAPREHLFKKALLEIEADIVVILQFRVYTSSVLAGILKDSKVILQQS
jgi:hypothetical protein